MNLNTLNPSGVDAVIVDLDGTMVDTMGDFNEALNRMLRDLSLPPIAADQAENMVGKGSEHLLRSVLKHVLAPVEQAQAAIKIEALFRRPGPATSTTTWKSTAAIRPCTPAWCRGCKPCRGRACRWLA